MDSESSRCADCGLPIVDGVAECQRRFDELLAMHFGNPLYFSVHRLFVDAYCLQHPDRGCISFKSLASHLAHMCWSVERSGSSAVPSEMIRRWVERHPDLEKPPLPISRGTLTIADIVATSPGEHQESVRQWARDIWGAYASLHATARNWVTLAFNQRRGT